MFTTGVWHCQPKESTFDSMKELFILQNASLQIDWSYEYVLQAWKTSVHAQRQPSCIRQTRSTHQRTTQTTCGVPRTHQQKLSVFKRNRKPNPREGPQRAHQLVNASLHCAFIVNFLSSLLAALMTVTVCYKVFPCQTANRVDAAFYELNKNIAHVLMAILYDMSHLNFSSFLRQRFEKNHLMLPRPSIFYIFP